jgi:hypothetical protein
MKNLWRHRKIILDVVRIILQNGYDYNKIFRRIMYLLRNKSTVAYTLAWFDSLYTDSGHTSVEYKNGKTIITIEDF